MGLRFQRRIKVFPSLRLNLSKSGVGLSVGARGAHIGITARGQRYTSIGLPGSGLSWREYHTPHYPAGHASVRTEPPAGVGARLHGRPDAEMFDARQLRCGDSEILPGWL